MVFTCLGAGFRDGRSIDCQRLGRVGGGDWVLRRDDRFAYSSDFRCSLVEL